MDIRKRLTELCDAFNAHDLDRIMVLFSDDCALQMPRGKHPMGLSFRGQAECSRSARDALSGLARR
jgi:ketosteroid isomerase-like protein